VAAISQSQANNKELSKGKGHRNPEQFPAGTLRLRRFAPDPGRSVAIIVSGRLYSKKTT
jgi:hypothetical protein